MVIASPEMLQSRTFINKLLRNPTFSQRIISFVVDEAHCVSLWGADFRKKYASLGIVRAFLPRGTPVIAMTATLTGRVRRDICSKLHFSKHGSQFQNEGNNRPNVSIVVRACKHPLVSFADLDFIIPTTIHCHTDIPKTYLYVDDINTGSQIVDHLSSLLKSRLQAGPPSAPASSSTRRGNRRCSSLEPGIIRPFNATLSKEYRNIAMAKFCEGDIRILVCTDAAGMVSQYQHRYLNDLIQFTDYWANRVSMFQTLTLLYDGSYRQHCQISSNAPGVLLGVAGDLAWPFCWLNLRRIKLTSSLPPKPLRLSVADDQKNKTGW